MGSRLLLRAVHSIVFLSLLLGTSHAFANMCHAVFKQMDGLDRAMRAEKVVLNLGPGRRVALEIVPPSSPDKPILIMEPGVERSPLLTLDFPLEMLQRGYGVVRMQFSVHYPSVAALGANERPYFRDRSPTMQDFAAEIEAVAKYLREERGFPSVVPMALSFSGGASVYLKGFPLVIESVPMTSAQAANPSAAEFRRKLEMLNVFNPFKAAVVRSTLDFAYRQHWKDYVDGMIEKDHLDPSLRSVFLDGYAAVSRATEDASWQGVKVPSDTRRLMIIGEHEDGELRRNQVATYKELMAQGKPVYLVVMRRGGHTLQWTWFHNFVDLIDEVSAPGAEFRPGVLILDPMTGHRERYEPGPDAIHALDRVFGEESNHG